MGPQLVHGHGAGMPHSIKGGVVREALEAVKGHAGDRLAGIAFVVHCLVWQERWCGATQRRLAVVSRRREGAKAPRSCRGERPRKEHGGEASPSRGARLTLVPGALSPEMKKKRGTYPNLT